MLGYKNECTLVFYEEKTPDEHGELYRKTAKQLKLVVPSIVSVELQVSVKVPQLMACQHCNVMRVTLSVSFMYGFTCTDS